MKRFTETKKWDDPWFVDLSAEHKAFWMYLCDKCDNAGVIDISLRIATFLLNCSNDVQGMLDDFVNSERIIKLDNGKYFIKGFVDFQFGTLHEGSNLHKNVIQLLKNHEIYDEFFKGKSRVNEPLIKGTSKGKGKGKGKGKEEGIVKGGNAAAESTAQHPSLSEKSNPHFDEPTPSEVKSYAESIGYPMTDEEAERFVNLHAARGWRDSRDVPIRNWKPIVATWKANSTEFRSKYGKNSKSNPEIEKLAKILGMTVEEYIERQKAQSKVLHEELRKWEEQQAKEADEWGI